MGYDGRGTRFESGRGRAKLAVGFLIAGIAGDGLGIVADGIRVLLVSSLMNGGNISTPALEASDSFVAIVGGIQFILLILSGIFFLRWIHRAYRNLGAFGAQGLVGSPGWAVGYWFVPFVSLYRPYMLTNEVWRASASETNPAVPEEWKRLPVPQVFPIWWTFWLLRNFAGTFFSSLSLSAKDLQDFIGVGTAGLSCDVLGIISAVLCIAVIRSIDRAQESRYEKSSVEFMGTAFVPADGYDDPADSTADIDGAFPSNTPQIRHED